MHFHILVIFTFAFTPFYTELYQKAYTIFLLSQTTNTLKSGLKPPLDLSTKIFNQPVSLPFFGCPTAGNRMFHWEGEAAAARAAAHHGTLYGLSSLATTGITEIGKLHDGPKVFQLYVWKDRELVKEVLAKAKEGGFHALALTVDFTWYGNRERGR